MSGDFFNGLQMKFKMGFNIKEEGNSCRICGNFADNYADIFNGELVVKIRKYLPIKVLATDDLPKSVCSSCVDHINGWHQFFVHAAATDAKLRGVLPAPEIVIKTEDEKGLSPLRSDDGDHDNDGDDGYLESDDEPLINKVTHSDKKEKKGKYSCSSCGKTTKTKKALANHVTLCTGKKGAAACDVCGQVYKSKFYLDKHKNKEHNSSLEQCKECHNYVKETKMRQHLKMMHNVKTKDYTGTKPIPCKYCDIIFYNRYRRAEHAKTAHMHEVVKCLQCDFTDRRDAVIRHTKNRHTGRVFTCTQCAMEFRTCTLLKHHMTTHSDIRRFTCDICGKGFKRLNNVKEHVKIHQAKSLQCQICGHFFQRKRYLAQHERTIHNFCADGSIPEPKKYECTVCGTQLKWKKNLVAHMRMHTGEKPYWCELCHVSFVSHGALRTHTKTKHKDSAPPPVVQDQSQLGPKMDVPKVPDLFYFGSKRI